MRKILPIAVIALFCSFVPFGCSKNNSNERAAKFGYFSTNLVTAEGFYEVARKDFGKIIEIAKKDELTDAEFLAALKAGSSGGSAALSTILSNANQSVESLKVAEESFEDLNSQGAFSESFKTDYSNIKQIVKSNADFIRSAIKGEMTTQNLRSWADDAPEANKIIERTISELVKAQKEK